MLSMSISLIAVFIPILLMGGIVGRFFHEFAMTLTIAIVISLVVSLTTTPMMCACSICDRRERKQGPLLRLSERGFEGGRRFYGRTLGWSLDNPGTIMFMLVIAIVLNFYLYCHRAQGLLPAEDTGQVFGGIRADQTISFQLMEQKFRKFVKIVSKDPAVENVAGSTGGGGGGPRGGATNTGNVFIQLKPLAERGGLSTDQVIERHAHQARRRHRRATVPARRGRTCASAAARATAHYQYTIQADTLEDLEHWVPKITDALQDVPELAGRQFRPRRPGAGGRSQDRPRDRGAARPHHLADRQHALRRLRPAPGLDDLQRPQPVSCGDGGGAAVLAEPGDAERHLCQHIRRRDQRHPGDRRGRGHDASISARHGASTAAAVAADAVRNQQLNALANSARGGASTGASVSTRAGDDGAAVGLRQLRPGHDAARGQSPGPVRRHHLLVQSAARASRSNQATAAIQRTMATINVPVSIHGVFAGTAQVFQESLSQRAAADPGGDPHHLYRARHSL